MMWPLENDVDQIHTWALQIDPEIEGKPDSGPSELKIQIKWDRKHGELSQPNRSHIKIQTETPLQKKFDKLRHDTIAFSQILSSYG